MTVKITVYDRRGHSSNHVVRNAKALGIPSLTTCRTSKLYFLAEANTLKTDMQSMSTESINRLCAFLLVDPVTEEFRWERVGERDKEKEKNAQSAHIIEVAWRPGVTDIAARELARGMAESGLPICEVATATRYELSGNLSKTDLHLLAQKLLANETVQEYALGEIAPHFGADAAASNYVERVPLAGLSDDALLTLSRNRLLSLDLAEMQAIQSFYAKEKRDPTDVELETLAQTWSEHCVHKTFKSAIHFTHQDADGNSIKEEEISSLFDQFIRGATKKAIQNSGKEEWVQSVFVDDAGIVRFDDQFDLAFKAETHNHPSALEPFGGANTGVGGVVRDILGVSARPIATTNVLCFGPQEYPHEALPDGVLHPKRIADGVVAGIGDYGNKLGLPTVNGAVVYDEGYLGNPLVFCGCVGLLPHGLHPTAARVDDLVVVLGGRTGRDGLHGATFSSAELAHDTAETTGSAVQIGDPITEKGLIELIEAARDQQLYTAITDCGAGGLSSSIGEMGEALGVDVELTKVLLKYPGLTPWEIWLSEAQERVVLAVPPTKLDALQRIANMWDVELCVLGHFTGDGDLIVRYDGVPVATLPMAFMHDGLPQRTMTAIWKEPPTLQGSAPSVQDANKILLKMLSHPTVASKESIVRQYDHEVRGGTIVRPFTGPEMDGPADAALLKPLGTWQHDMGFTLSVGINPLLGKCDPYAMAVSAVDEAFRNAVAVGADPDQIAILDNFCWGNPTYPDRLGALVQASRGCHDGAVAYGAPFISGKDSLYNEFDGRPIPGTILISALGIAPNIHRRTTSDLKVAGNALYLLGETHAELGGSLLYHLLDHADGQAPAMPADPLTRYRLLHQAILQGLVAACHDLSEGGLGVAVAEMALGGRLGARINLWGDPTTGLVATDILFSESNGRLLLEVAQADTDALEAHFAGQTLTRLGTVTENATGSGTLTVASGDETLVDLSVDQLVKAWKSPAEKNL